MELLKAAETGFTRNRQKRESVYRERIRKMTKTEIWTTSPLGHLRNRKAVSGKRKNSENAGTSVLFLYNFPL
jgi:hypothetical protein